MEQNTQTEETIKMSEKMHERLGPIHHKRDRIRKKKKKENHE
jgi:hypothetical protein